MSKPIIDAVRPAVWMLAALGAAQAASASDTPIGTASEAAPATVTVDGPVAIGFFPPMTREQWDADTEGRFAQEMSDIEIALGDVKACVGDERLRTECIPHASSAWTPARGRGCCCSAMPSGRRWA
jgi:hypothetical protein